MPLSYRNQSINLLFKSVDWFLYDNGLRHERVKSLDVKNLYKEEFLPNHETASSRFLQTQA